MRVGVAEFFLIWAIIIGLSVWLDSKKPSEEILCPHGHEDWDDCPVCGH